VGTQGQVHIFGFWPVGHACIVPRLPIRRNGIVVGDEPDKGRPRSHGRHGVMARGEAVRRLTAEAAVAHGNGPQQQAVCAGL
jgi:hypothetical protein